MHRTADERKEEETVKNRIFTGKFVLAPKFAGASTMEDYYGWTD
mgnify:CR=1 FL=1